MVLLLINKEGRGHDAHDDVWVGKHSVLLARASNTALFSAHRLMHLARCWPATETKDASHVRHTTATGCL